MTTIREYNSTTDDILTRLRNDATIKSYLLRFILLGDYGEGYCRILVRCSYAHSDGSSGFIGLLSV